jgi:hypothetical protein
MELEGSLPCPQEPANGSYSEPDKFSPHISTLCPQIHLNIFLPFTPSSYEWSLAFRFSDQGCFYEFFFTPMHATCLHSSHRSWCGHSNDILWSIEVTKFLIMQSSPASYHFLPLSSKYSPQHPTSQTPPICVLPLVWKTKFHTHKSSK